MKICAIICEYNPLHSGHAYHIQQSKIISNCDYLIAVISGNFTQRGEVAIADKYARAKWAISSGIDLVIELPLPFSISSAQDFSFYAIKMMSSVKAITHISFGSECGDIDLLKKASLYTPNKKLIKQSLSIGKTFTESYFDGITDVELKKVFLSPNNLLAVEYLRAINKLKSKIIPITIKRQGCDYNDKQIDQQFASSSGIRNKIFQDKTSEIQNYLGENVTFKKLPNQALFNNLLLSKCITKNLKEIKKINGVEEGIENRIKRASIATNFVDFFTTLSTKRYPAGKINRILLCNFFDIDKRFIKKCKKLPPLLKALAVNKNSKAIFSAFNNLIIRFEDTKSIKNPILKNLLNFSKSSDAVYQVLTDKKLPTNLLIV